MEYEVFAPEIGWEPSRNTMVGFPRVHCNLSSTPSFISDIKRSEQALKERRGKGFQVAI